MSEGGAVSFKASVKTINGTVCRRTRQLTAKCGADRLICSET